MLNSQFTVRNLAFTIFLLFAMMGCTSVSIADVQSVAPVVKIGMVAPFEGERRSVGYDVIHATRLAVRQVNEAGGIDGYRVALVAFDDSGFADEASNVAEALIVDPGIVAVVGHWDIVTNEAAGALYDSADLAWLPMGTDQLNTFDPINLPTEFTQAYQAVGQTPPGPYAGVAYDAMQLIFEAIDRAADDGKVTRATVAESLSVTTIDGMTGTLRQP